MWMIRFIASSLECGTASDTDLFEAQRRSLGAAFFCRELRCWLLQHELLAGCDVVENRLLSVRPFNPQFVDLRSCAKSENLLGRILPGQVARDGHLTHLRGATQGRLNAAAGSRCVRWRPLQPDPDIIAAARIVLPESCAAEQELQDVDVAVIIKVGANHTAPFG